MSGGLERYLQAIIIIKRSHNGWHAKGHHFPLSGVISGHVTFACDTITAVTRKMTAPRARRDHDRDSGGDIAIYGLTPTDINQSYSWWKPLITYHEFN